MHLSRQLGAFVRAGLPIIEAVHTLGEEAQNTTVRRVLADIEDGLHRGETPLGLPRPAPARSSRTYYRGILRSAELTGQLDTVLDQLAKYLERDLEARRKIKSALIYPAIIVGACRSSPSSSWSASCCPRFQVFFAELDAELPLPTRILLGVTDFIAQWWWAVLGGVGRWSLLVAPHRCGRNGGRLLRDRILLRLPVIGDDRPVRAGRAVLPGPRLDGRRRRAAARGDAGRDRVGAQPGLRAGRWPRSARRCWRARAWPGRCRATRPVPRHRRPDDPGRRGDRHARHAARGRRPLLRERARLQAQEAHRRSSSRRSSSSWAWSSASSPSRWSRRCTASSVRSGLSARPRDARATAARP